MRQLAPVNVCRAGLSPKSLLAEPVCPVSSTYEQQSAYQLNQNQLLHLAHNLHITRLEFNNSYAATVCAGQTGQQEYLLVKILGVACIDQC
jgi:hypothetical protein